MTTVLLVDDDQGFREGIRQLLEIEQGFQVLGEAADGGEACELARRLRPDVVLMDIVMPGLDGLEATRKIKARQPRTKVVILTGHDDEKYLRATLDCGADGFVIKSNFAAILLATLRDLSP